MKKMIYNHKVTFFAFLIAIVVLLGHVMTGREYEVFASEFPYYGTLDIQWKGWKSYNAGINYNLTGGTSGTLKQGDALKVLNEKKNESGNMVSYCYSETLGYCYVSSRYIVRTELDEEMMGSPVTQKMEEQYGKEYFRLFDEAPEFLYGSVAESYELKCLQYCNDAFYEQDKSIGTSVFWEVLANGKDIIWNELFSKGGYSKSAEEKNRMEAVKYLLSTLYGNEAADFISEVNSDTNDIMDVVEWLDTASDVKEEELITKLKKAYKHIPGTVVEDLVEKQFDVSSLDTVAESVTIAKEVLATLEIYTVELNTLEKLQSYVEPTSELYQDLELVKKEIEKDPIAHIASFGTTELIKGLSEQLFEEMLGSIGSNVSLGVDVATMVFGFIQENIYQGPDIDDYAKTAYLMSYYWELDDAFGRIRTDIKEKDGEITYKEIASFEELYFVKNQAIHAVLEHCKGIEGKSAYNDLLSADTVKYENYIKTCMKNYYEARKKVVLDVPLYTQKTTYTCGVASVKMVLDYLGIKNSSGSNYSESTLWKWANGNGQGTYVYRIAQTLTNYGVAYKYLNMSDAVSEDYWNELEKSLKNDRLVIIPIKPTKNSYWDYNTGHYIVVTGMYIDGDGEMQVIINDCHYKYSEEDKVVPLKELVRVSKNHSAYIIVGK